VVDHVFAPDLRAPAMSVTRQMAAAFPRLKALSAAKGLRLHHLGAGYPHPEVGDPREYIAHRDAYLRHVAARDGGDGSLRSLLTGLFGYTDTLGPASTREAFAAVYGRDLGFAMDPSLLIPTMGATGGISLMCSLYERTGRSVAYLVDAPTYTGFLSRAGLYQRAHFYSVELDAEGPVAERLREQIERARADGHLVAFYYTVPDGHNPGGISFSAARRAEILAVLRETGTYVVEDAPYVYISHEPPQQRVETLVALDPTRVVHLFTASKLGLPGPRVGYFYSDVAIEVDGGRRTKLRDLVLTEASGDILFQNPEALRGFEAYLMDEEFRPRESLWPLAAVKNAVYGENRRILLDGLAHYLGDWPDLFRWTSPGAGFFSVFTFVRRNLEANQAFVERLVADYGVVTIPMFGFYPRDAIERDPGAGLDQIRLSFSFNESFGDARRADMEAATRAFADAVRRESGLPGVE
jgi:DNA-binding transcriptional MocR family regulator